VTQVAITGIGVVGPAGVGVENFRRLLRGGVSAIAAVDRFSTEGLCCHKAAAVPPFPAKEFISPMKLRRMNLLSRYALTAAKLAVLDAGLEGFPQPGESVGVAMGTAFGPVQTSVDYMAEYVEKGAALAPPQLFAESVANAPGGHIAIELGLRGFNVTLTQRESSMMAAAMCAATQIAKGAASAALIGGVDELNEMIFSVLARIGALAHATGDASEASRPFDCRRNGVVLGEGGTVLVAETAEGARQRGARVYGTLSGFAIGRDTTASISDWGEGADQVAAVMKRALGDAAIEPGSVDAIWASANSSIRGDRVEARAIEHLFGRDIPPLVATKGYFGEYAAAGGHQLASALIALADQELPGSAGFGEAEPGIDLPIVRELRPARLRHILANSVSAGGGVISAVVSRVGDE
jgi:3-oxoacyl-[acyl-carrier-protein] synthase II